MSIKWIDVSIWDDNRWRASSGKRPRNGLKKGVEIIEEFQPRNPKTG